MENGMEQAATRYTKGATRPTDTPLLLPHPCLAARCLGTTRTMATDYGNSIGLILCVTSTIVAASIYALLDDVEFNSSDSVTSATFAGGYSLLTVTALSCIPLLIFLMVRYVSLRLYLRN